MTTNSGWTWTSSLKWEVNGDYASFMFILAEDADIAGGDVKITPDSVNKHNLLELLGLLQVIEYHRGYDGHYYDIGIRKK